MGNELVKELQDLLEGFSKKHGMNNSIEVEFSVIDNGDEPDLMCFEPKGLFVKSLGE